MILLNYSINFLAVFSLFMMINNPVSASQAKTMRVFQFDNDKVSVWETVIYPSKNQVLKMHRHEHNRVVVALSDGVLKITNDKGKAHYLKLEKNKAYYLSKDIPNELHNDQNMSTNPIKVLVIELKN
ncbi:MAG: hypothetical protein NTW08_01715 [Gammaproteobacteria bacterium]|nr:hypothetical protein [Gammaproteobacteria bacterium]